MGVVTGGRQQGEMVARNGRAAMMVEREAAAARRGEGQARRGRRREQTALDDSDGTASGTRPVKIVFQGRDGFDKRTE
jgi:hypothetical protein